MKKLNTKVEVECINTSTLFRSIPSYQNMDAEKALFLIPKIEDSS